jgi:lipopolysaccharide biosynthesis glycosyltransferase
MNNLPTGIWEPFRDVFVPLLWEFVGTTTPWESPSADMTFNMWSIAHSNANSQLDDGLMWMVTKIVSSSSFSRYQINSHI